MENMRFKVGDRVKVKSLQWFNENKNNNYDVVVDGGWCFSKPMSIFCGKELIIKEISHTTNPPYYEMKDNMFAWTDEMIEGLVEEPVLSAPNITEGVFIHEKDMKWITEYILPDGYIFKDENGNVINAQKIVLEKKKKEYPKTYEECCKELNIAVRDLDILDNMLDTTEIIYRKNLDRLLNSFRKLLICRDAYWQLYGEEMGLKKPWEPDYKNPDIDLYVIINIYNRVEKAKYGYGFESCVFTFPTEEMRDQFYENFKEEIEFVKELL